MEIDIKKKKLIIKIIAGVILSAIVIVILIGRGNDEGEVAYGVEEVSVAEELESNGEALSGGGIYEGEQDSSSTIYVDVSGCVWNPQVVQIDRGSRVFQAIDACGGSTEDADTKFMNLAAVLSDGDKIYVPSAEETDKSAAEKSRSEAAVTSVIGGSVVDTTGGSASSAAGSTTDGNSADALVNINTADLTELQTLNGVGPSTAQKIIDYRAANGSFQTIEDLKNVDGIGDKTFEKFADKICV